MALITSRVAPRVGETCAALRYIASKNYFSASSCFSFPVFGLLKACLRVAERRNKCSDRSMEEKLYVLLGYHDRPTDGQTGIFHYQRGNGVEEEKLKQE